MQALHRGDIPAALACLRTELSPMAGTCNRTERLHDLASCLLCSTPADLEQHSVWDGGSSGGGVNDSVGSARSHCIGEAQVPQPDAAACTPNHVGECGSPAGPLGQLRRRALARLGGLLPPYVLLPPRRLEVLVEQALEWQLAHCPLHNSPGAVPSLLADYSCGMEQVPTVTTQVQPGGRCSGIFFAMLGKLVLVAGNG